MTSDWKATAVDSIPAPKVSCLLGETVPVEDSGHTLRAPYQPLIVTVEPPDEKAARQPSDIVVVLDVSGSMGTEATIKNASGAGESHGLSLLDIAKHGIRTVINTLGNEDRLGIVCFHYEAWELLPLTLMDKAGQKLAEARLETVCAGGGTNIWNGLEMALATVEKGSQTIRGRALAHTMLLTDGVTVNKDDVMPNLSKYRGKAEQLPCTLSTFGFGYGIESPLLCDIASFGDGTYSFIPDAGFVGTIFINTLCNLLLVMSREVTVTLEAKGREFLKVKGGHRAFSSPDAFVVNLGTLQYQQSRTVVLEMVPNGSAPVDIAARVSCKMGQPCVEKTITSQLWCESLEDISAENTEVEHLRSRYVDLVNEVIKAGLASTMAAMVESLAKDLENSKVKTHPSIAALREDVCGQTSEAVSRQDWYDTWGRHYLPSIMFAHRSQICNNFKDPSVQVYGGELFQDLQEQADDIFNKLPAPKPSTKRASGRAGYGGGAAPVSMSAYNDRHGVCIDSESLVEVVGKACDPRAGVDQKMDRRLQTIGSLRPGDMVEAVGGTTAEVICIVRTKCKDARALLVELPCGSRVTPYHPIRQANGTWCFPAALATPAECDCDAVCSIVLNGAPGIMLMGSSRTGKICHRGGTAAVALSHGLEEGVANHPYFGTQAVLEDLRLAPDFKSGFVQVEAHNVQRDPETGLVSKFYFGQ